MRARPLLGAVLAQAQTEILLTIRRGESMLVTVIIPAGLLLFFASSRVLPAQGRTVGFLLPGTLTLAVISTGLVSLGIATAYERYYGVLKRYGLTPFPRAGLLIAKMLAVVCLEALQIALLVLISAVGFGWRFHGSVVIALLALVLGTACFSGLGLAMAGGLRAEATLALANGLFLFFLLLGGLYVPLDHLPGALVPLAEILPAWSLADVLRAALSPDGHLAAASFIKLCVWALAAPTLASWVFRWD